MHEDIIATPYWRFWSQDLKQYSSGAPITIPAARHGAIDGPGRFPVSEVERLRRAPARAPGPQMAPALDRLTIRKTVSDAHDYGVQHYQTKTVPVGGKVADVDSSLITSSALAVGSWSSEPGGSVWLTGGPTGLSGSTATHELLFRFGQEP